jgi:hypothetical protein
MLQVGRWWCSLGAALLLTPTVVLAQAPAATFAEMPRVLETGRTVVVTDSDGRRTKGRVAEITPSSLTLLVRDSWGMERRQLFPESGVRAINRSDSIWNGLLIGLGAGIVASEVFVRQNCGPRGHDDECAAIVTAIGVVTFVPGGATVGALIDKFTGNDLLYRAGPRSTLSIAPIVGRATGGVAVSLRF